MESSSGSDRATPAPRRNVRRGMCFLVINLMNAISSLLFHRSEGRALFRRSLLHLKRGTIDYAVNQIGKPEPARLGVSDDLPDRRNIVVFEAPSERVRHQLFRHHADEYFGPRGQHGAETGGSSDAGAL